MNPHHAARATAIVRVLTTQRNTQQSGGLADAFAAADVEVLSPSTLTTVIPAKAAIGFTHLWPAISRPSTAHTPLAREAGRGRGPLRSNGRVRGVPVTSFFAVPHSQTAAIFTSRSAPRDRAPLTLPTLTRWAPPSPRCRGARCIGDRRTCPQKCVNPTAAFAGMTDL